METSKNIGVLSLLFTAGIAIRVFIPELTGSPFTAAFVSSVFCFFCGTTALVRPGSSVSDGALTAVFVFLGVLCTASGEIISQNGSGGLPGLMTGDPLQKVRRLIASMPFPDERTGALLTALLTGDRSGLTPEIRRVFRDSGASHLLALSGLHIGILYMIMDRLFWVFGGNPLLRGIRSLAIIALAILFTLATGSSPSLVRACIFICLREGAILTNRHAPPLNILTLALIVQLCINPFAIRTVGFQLSYAAVAGIFLIFPWLEAMYSPRSGPSSPASRPSTGSDSFSVPPSSPSSDTSSGSTNTSGSSPSTESPHANRRRRAILPDPMHRIWTGAALSISCQITTAPIAWYYFRSFPQYFLLTNLIAIPLTTAFMGLALLTLTLSALGLCPSLLISATDLITRALLRSLEIISTM